MRKLTIFLLAAAGVLLSTTVSAQPKPRWVRKGVTSLNQARSNESYRFQVFATSGDALDPLKAGRFTPLKEYVGARYGVRPEAVHVDSLAVDGRTTYLLSFLSPEGHPAEVQAQLVDDWGHLKDDLGASWGFEFYQLYALSEGAETPQFDTFRLTERYGIQPLFMSLIPGLGQIYKGQPGKGYALLGAEVLLAGGIAYTSIEKNRYERLARQQPDFRESYESNALDFRRMRNAFLIAGGALYLYNLIDAAVARGARRVVVERPNLPEAEFAFAPVVTESGVGVGLSVRF